MLPRPTTFFDCDIELNNGYAVEVSLNNQPSGIRVFNNHLKVSQNLYTNSIKGIVNNGILPSLSIGSIDSCSAINMSCNEGIIIEGKTFVYLNSAGGITIESPTSITLKSPKIIMQGEIYHDNTTGFDLKNYNSVRSPQINTTNVNGFSIQQSKLGQLFHL